MSTLRFCNTIASKRDAISSSDGVPVFCSTMMSVSAAARFMQSDIVNFQRQGWRAEKILAGLAAVLAKNVFLYVASIPNLAALGSRFVLQGGTQNNLAVARPALSALKLSRTSGTAQRATKTRAATSARTTACEPLSMSM